MNSHLTRTHVCCLQREQDTRFELVTLSGEGRLVRHQSYCASGHDRHAMRELKTLT